MRLSKLVSAVNGGRLIAKGEWERNIEALSADSREKHDNTLFFCLIGENADGHAYAAEAIKNGAVALVSERELFVEVPQIIVQDVRETLGILASVFYGEPSQKMQVIGVTGTNGKTTTAHMLTSILSAAGKRVGVIGTLGVSFGSTRYVTDLTTPDPIPLQSMLAEMYARGAEYVVMEVSAHALHYNKTIGIRFAAGIFTNFTQDHLDFFHTMPRYKAEKAKLFSPKITPIAILNGDDEVGREFAKMRETGNVKTVFYGLNTPADAFAIVTDDSLLGTECMLNVNDQLCRVSLHLVGQHNVYNALAAAACAIELGIDAQYVASGLNSLRKVEGRLQRVESGQVGEIYVDFAHTPDGLARTLETLKKYCKGRLICLFGCGGNRDKTKRPIMGEVVAKKADFSILTSDNPRYEDPLDIIAGIEKGYRRFSVKYVIVPDRKRAIAYGIDFLQKGDILLIAGKGGEEYQEIMGIKYPFKDHDIIAQTLFEKRKK
ncbi:MAG: UDP-N-acetylmuramoyl-L-alanyl-D-glutamate--2,6-diaminopimelate ligase [Clostridiales bacterium]|nr:UDP-N-acetylmuramoyl-L-alanyl-D-glutamate--2,6-diaminopimelate ligase [Clostridiales bacterium]